MSKFFVDPSAISGSHIYIEDKNDLHHLTKVLRGKVGMKIDISDGDAWEYETELEELTADCATLRILDKQKFASEPEVRVTLFQGVPKASKMETVIQKTVEIGVDSIVPVFMERTVVVEKGNFGKKLDRWQKIADEAVKQCKRGIIPQVRENCTFKEMMSRLKEYDLVICPYENEDGYSMKDCLRRLSDEESKPQKVAIIIGPEGGFADKEIDALKESGAEIVTLGKTILRTETAGLVALTMVMYELEL
ncbi:MAG: 16S rRNA (uracil(1498)-N(3))-methyltransferase [Firmicutes bacterium]|nr:16S rRNA (uracil(1498)-N(3))-methyltransferase [Bacillota bacterium]